MMPEPLFTEQAFTYFKAWSMNVRSSWVFTG